MFKRVLCIIEKNVKQPKCPEMNKLGKSLSSTEILNNRKIFYGFDTKQKQTLEEYLYMILFYPKILCVSL